MGGLVTAAAHADPVGTTIDATYDGQVGTPASVKITGSVTTATTHAGAFKWTRSSTFNSVTNNYSTGVIGGANTNIPALGQDFFTFCIDITQGAANSVFTIVDLENGPIGASGGPGVMGAARAGMLRELYGRYFSPNFNNPAANPITPEPTNLLASTTVASAAFQLAAWEIVYDGLTDIGAVVDNTTSTGFVFTPNLGATSTFATAGATQFTNVDPGIISLARDFLNGLNGDGNVSVVYAATSSVNQDQMMLFAPNITIPSPLPPVAWSGLALMGLAAAGKVRGRLLTRNQA